MTPRDESIAAACIRVRDLKGRPMLNAFRTVLPFVVTALLAAPCLAAEPQPASKRQQYVYVLKLTPRMQEANAWTDTENGVIGQHFARLARATDSGQVILAGRTTEALDKTFGLVIFEAEGEEAARQFMKSDPAVVANIMSATLHPYSVALYRKVR
jgi:uncharacterized protein YciI